MCVCECVSVYVCVCFNNRCGVLFVVVFGSLFVFCCLLSLFVVVVSGWCLFVVCLF